jgi:hypothetical protein
MYEGNRHRTPSFTNQTKVKRNDEEKLQEGGKACRPAQQ